MTESLVHGGRRPGASPSVANQRRSLHGLSEACKFSQHPKDGRSHTTISSPALGEQTPGNMEPTCPGGSTWLELRSSCQPSREQRCRSHHVPPRLPHLPAWPRRSPQAQSLLPRLCLEHTKFSAASSQGLCPCPRPGRLWPRCVPWPRRLPAQTPFPRATLTLFFLSFILYVLVFTSSFSPSLFLSLPSLPSSFLLSFLFFLLGIMIRGTKKYTFPCTLARWGKTRPPHSAIPHLSFLTNKTSKFYSIKGSSLCKEITCFCLNQQQLPPVPRASTLPRPWKQLPAALLSTPQGTRRPRGWHGRG